MSKKLLTSLLTASLLAFGCSNSDDNNSNTNNNGQDPTINKDAVISVEMTEHALTAADVPELNDASKIKAFADGVNAFSKEFIDAYQPKGSYVYSPFSIHSAVSMAAYGTAGDTYNELASALHLDSDRDAAAKLNGDMRLRIRYDGQDPKSVFNIANRIWVDGSVNVLDSFKTSMDKNYKAPLQVVDFIAHADDIVGIINQWVSNNTGEMIKNLLAKGQLTADTRMVLVNAVYFNGKWLSPFEHESTYSQDFHISSSETKQVEIMHQKGGFKVYDGANYQALVMDYALEAGGPSPFAMLIILPNEIDGLASVSATLTADEISKMVAQSSVKNGYIAFPKFKIETDIQNAVEIFEKLGVSHAFSDADFSNLTKDMSLFISKIIHKAVIEVDEDGTKAAAATAVIADEAASVEPEPELKFVADHPFAFAIVHRAENIPTVLFAGQYLGN